MSESREDPQNKPEDDGLDTFVLDEAFVAAAAFKEPTARQRKGNAFSRWRWARRVRRSQRKRQRAQRAAWKAAGLTADSQPGRGKGAKTFAVVFTVVVVAVGLLTIAREQRFGPWAGAGDDRTTAGAADAGTGSDAPAPPPAPTLQEPFKGSPAEDFADGEAGFVMPKATAMGGFTKAEVAGFYRRSRELLVTARLDRRTLLGGRPEAFIKALHPEQRTNYLRNLNHRDPEQRTRSWVTVFAPRTAALAGSVIKVKGTTEVKVARQGSRRGLLVKHNYLFVYPVHRPGRPDTLIRLVSHVESEVFNYRENGRLYTWLSGEHTSNTPVLCEIDDDYVHPDYPADRMVDSNDASATGPLEDPYDLTTEGTDTGCGQAEKT